MHIRCVSEKHGSLFSDNINKNFWTIIILTYILISYQKIVLFSSRKFLMKLSYPGETFNSKDHDWCCSQWSAMHGHTRWRLLNKSTSFCQPPSSVFFLLGLFSNHFLYPQQLYTEPVYDVYFCVLMFILDIV